MPEQEFANKFALKPPPPPERSHFTSVAALKITVQAAWYWNWLYSETTQLQNPDASSTTPWRAIYFGVIVFAALVILSLFLFSQYFSG
jgi:hypothetical protein